MKTRMAIVLVFGLLVGAVRAAQKPAPVLSSDKVLTFGDLRDFGEALAVWLPPANTPKTSAARADVLSDEATRQLVGRVYQCQGTIYAARSNGGVRSLMIHLAENHGTLQIVTKDPAHATIGHGDVIKCTVTITGANGGGHMPADGKARWHFNLTGTPVKIEVLSVSP